MLCRRGMINKDIAVENVHYISNRAGLDAGMVNDEYYALLATDALLPRENNGPDLPLLTMGVITCIKQSYGITISAKRYINILRNYDLIIRHYRTRQFTDSDGNPKENDTPLYSVEIDQAKLTHIIKKK